MTQTLGDLASQSPAAARIFERFAIDYCCGGRRTLEEACRAAGVPVQQVIAAIEAESTVATAPGRDWNTAPLTGLMAHIRSTHHTFTRAEILRLGPLFEKVCAKHGPNHPELSRMSATFAALAAELSTHLMKEELVLFPYIERMEEASIERSPVPPPPFGSVRNPIAMMAAEHDGAGEALRQLRAASDNYTVPPEACPSFRALFQALAGFEADLHQHIHLENNILFPRAIAMEQRAASQVPA